MANEDIFKAFHKALIDTGDINNSFYVYNDAKTAMILYTEADPSSIKRMILEREDDKYISIDKVKQAKEEIENETFTAFGEYDNPSSYYDVVEVKDVLAILDGLISEGEET